MKSLALLEQLLKDHVGQCDVCGLDLCPIADKLLLAIADEEADLRALRHD